MNIRNRCRYLPILGIHKSRKLFVIEFNFLPPYPLPPLPLLRVFQDVEKGDSVQNLRHHTEGAEARKGTNLVRGNGRDVLNRIFLIFRWGRLCVRSPALRSLRITYLRSARMGAIARRWRGGTAVCWRCVWRSGTRRRTSPPSRTICRSS